MVKFNKAFVTGHFYNAFISFLFNSFRVFVEKIFLLFSLADPGSRQTGANSFALTYVFSEKHRIRGCPPSRQRGHPPPPT